MGCEGSHVLEFACENVDVPKATAQTVIKKEIKIENNKNVPNEKGSKSPNNVNKNVPILLVKAKGILGGGEKKENKHKQEKEHEQEHEHEHEQEHEHEDEHEDDNQNDEEQNNESNNNDNNDDDIGDD